MATFVVTSAAISWKSSLKTVMVSRMSYTVKYRSLALWQDLVGSKPRGGLRICPAVAAGFVTGDERHGGIRVGYYATCVGEHVTAYLMLAIPRRST